MILVEFFSFNYILLHVCKVVFRLKKRQKDSLRAMRLGCQWFTFSATSG